MFVFQGTGGVPWPPFCYNWEIKIQGREFVVCCFELSLRFKFVSVQEPSSTTIYASVCSQSLALYSLVCSFSADCYRDALFSLQPRYQTAAGSSMSKPQRFKLILPVVASRHHYNFFLFDFAWTSSLFFLKSCIWNSMPVTDSANTLVIFGASALMMDV